MANINIFLKSDFIGQKLQWEPESPILLVQLWRRTMLLFSPVVFQRFLAITPIFPFSFFYPFSLFSKPWPFCDIPLSSALTKCCCLSLCYVWKWIKWRWGEMGHCVASAFGTHCVQSSQLPWSPLEAYRGAIQHCFFFWGGGLELINLRLFLTSATVLAHWQSGRLKSYLVWIFCLEKLVFFTFLCPGSSPCK